MTEEKPQPQKRILSDITNAELFAQMHKEKVLWCKKLGGWFLFNGKTWEADDNDKIKIFAMETIEALAFICHEIKTDIAHAHLKRTSSSAGINSMLECAKGLLGISLDRFDANELLFNCKNGTINIKTREFYPFRPSDLITKSGNVEYIPGAECPRWNKFLNEIFLSDKEIIDFMQRVIGYTLTNSIIEECMFILYGQGRNGKSKFIESIYSIMKDYAVTCPRSTFVVKQNPGIPNDVARLKGARMVTAMESSQNTALDEELIKKITGGDPISARFLNKEYFDFYPTFKIFFTTNHLPRIRGTDTGIWRRIHMIPFLLNVTEEQEDRQLGEKLKAESSGIFNWMLDGYKAYKEQGLNVPLKIREHTQLYREEEDDIGKFIKEECILDKKGLIGSKEFCEKFEEVMGYKRGNRSIADYMSKSGFRPVSDSRAFYQGKRQHCFFGLKWDDGTDKSKQVIENPKEKFIEWEE